MSKHAAKLGVYYHRTTPTVTLEPQAAGVASQKQITATNNARDAIVELAESFIKFVGASGSYVQFINQFVEYVQQRNQTGKPK
jgi:hypothetical protein